MDAEDIKEIQNFMRDVRIELRSIRNEIVSVKTDVQNTNLRLTAVEQSIPPPPPPTGSSIILDSSASLPLPFYDPKSMSPNYFIKEVEDYFTWKQIDPVNWHLLVGRFFDKDSDISRWWAATKTKISKWDEFCAQFIKYEQTDNNMDALAQSLFSKNQSIDEAFETFCWEVATLFKRIDAKATDQAIIERILNSCIPELSISLRSGSYSTISDLICRGRVVISNLNKTRLAENKPLLRGRSTDPIHKQNLNGHFKNKTFFKSKQFYNDQKSSHSQYSNIKSNSNVNANSVQASILSNDTKSTAVASNGNEQNNEHCRYCKATDHCIDSCAKLKAKEHKKKQNKPSSQGN